MPSSRQTISFLQRRFAEAGLEPDSRKGQSFLIDLNLVDLIARSADLSGDDVVLEIGTGLGSLTTRLSERAAAVVTVEIDNHLFQLAQEELAHVPNVLMLQQDVLKNKNRLSPNVVAQVQQVIRRVAEKQPGCTFKLVANLPFNVATPIISNLLRSEIRPRLMAVTIQKELADRITARPRTKDYSSLSIWVQAQCHAEIVRVLPPSVFWPRPKVESAIIRICPMEEKRSQIEDLEFFHQFVRLIFLHRRKFLRSNLVSGFKGRLGKAQVDDALQELGLGGESRSEELDISTALALCRAVQHRLATP